LDHPLIVEVTYLFDHALDVISEPVQAIRAPGGMPALCIDVGLLEEVYG
jgi:hypothetical protein